MTTNVLKGTDPEYFILGPDNKPVPAFKLGFPDKHDKLVLRHGKAFRDGYAIEINVEPSLRWDVVTDAVRLVMKEIQNKHLPADHRLLSMPTVRIDLEKDMVDAPLDMMTFGCDPSMDAYTGMPKLPDIDATEHPYRYSGGHLHFSEPGVKEDSKHWLTNIDRCRTFIRMMDVYLGIPLTAIFNRPQTYMRRKYYGQAGEFRQQHYADGTVGVEYRTPGPEVFNHPAISHFAMAVGEHIFANFEKIEENWSDRFTERIKDAINTGVGLGSYIENVRGLYSVELIDWLGKNPPFNGLELPEHLHVSDSTWFRWAIKATPASVKTNW